MKGIKIDTTIRAVLGATNFDATICNIEKENGVCIISDGGKSNGVLSNKWAQYLCEKTPLKPIMSLKNLKLFIDNIWEDFYDKTIDSIKDPFLKNKFEKQGSFSTFAACWFSQKNSKAYYKWLSYGNSAILLYDTKKDELFVPQFKDSLLGFLKNKGQINWNDDNLKDEFFIYGRKKEFNKDLKIILATDAIAEHLALSYLILKSRDDDYWENLQQLMRSDQKLSALIYNNRESFAYNSFNELLERWQKEDENNTVSDYVNQLQRRGQLAVDDVAL